METKEYNKDVEYFRDKLINSLGILKKYFPNYNLKDERKKKINFLIKE